MSKYIDAEKLIAEIERWRDKAKEKYNESTYSMGRCDALAEFRNHIVSLQQEQPVLPGIEDPGIPGKDFIPVEWVDACEKYGKWKIVKVEQPDMDLENYISNKLHELGADLINHKPYSFNRGLNVGKTKAYEDILGRLNTRKEE